MRLRTLARLISVGFLVFQSMLFATPSTQIWIPSTDVQAYLDPHIGWDVYLTNTGAGFGAQPGSVSNGGITMGVLPFKKIGLEVGIDYRDLGGNHSYPVYFNAKLATPEDAFFKYMPAIAIGGYDYGTKKNVNNYDVTYGLIARTFPLIGRLSVGGYTGLGPDLLWTGSDGMVVSGGVLASWDRVIKEISDKLWLAIDFQSGNNGYGAFSFGAQWNWSANVSTILGYDIYNDKNLAKPTVTFQLDINSF